MPDNHTTNYQGLVGRIIQKEFGKPPTSISRLKNGICNEVYLVNVGGREVVIRMNEQQRYLFGSHNHIPIFKAKGIRVPDILAEDYTRSAFPVAYHIVSKIEGRDINDCIDTLTDDQLRGVAREIANVFRQLRHVPNNGKFGVLWGDDNDLVDSWSAEVARVTEVVTRWGTKSGVIDGRLKSILRWINDNFRSYFDGIRPVTYFGDLASKNVMIHDGRFSGLVDLDALAQGDPLEAIGRIKASWYGTKHGRVYSEALMDELRLTTEQRKIVTMYALLNRTFWTMENGVQFNQNTSAVVDRAKEAADKAVVGQLLAELQDGRGEGSFQPTYERGSAPRKPHMPEEKEATAGEPRAAAPLPHAAPEPAMGFASEPKPVPVIVRRPIDLGRVTGNLPPIPGAPAKPEARKGVDAIPCALPSISHPSGRTKPVILETIGLSKTYSGDGVDFQALCDVDLKIEKGDCVAIVGKSGSGKSTLMHLLACLDMPTTGNVYVDGEDTSTLSESAQNRLRNEKFGFVFQQFFLNGRDTVYENVVLPMRIRGAGMSIMSSEVADAIAAVGLTDKTDKKAKDLSGGEKQRVCIARALVGGPEVIFADEPTGNLDSHTGAAVENLLLELNREKGITLVIVTHDDDLAARCDRIIEMKDGRILRQKHDR